MKVPKLPKLPELPTVPEVLKVDLTFKRGVWNQYLAGCIAGLSYGCCGIAYAWVNPVLLSLLTPRSQISLTIRQVSWTATLPQIGSILSPLVSGYLADKIGRKTLLLLTSPLQILSWVALVFLHDFISVCIIRTLQGIVMGCVETILPMYLCEISDNQNRGRVSVLYSLGWTLGLLYEYSLGPFVLLKQLDWLNAAPPTIFLLIFHWFPESPYYLVMKGRVIEAAQALSVFRPKGYSTHDELLNIELSLAQEKKDLSDWTDLIRKKEGRRGIMIVVIISTTFSFCGAMPVLSYCNETFQLVTGQQLFSQFLTIAVSLVLTLVTVVTLFTVDKIGRRAVLITSYAGGSICLIPTAVYFYLDQATDINVKEYYLIPVVCLVIFPSFITLGAMTIVHAYQAELFSTSTRSIGSAFITLVSALTATISLESYFPLLDHKEDYINFFTYSSVSVLGLVFAIFAAPETKGYDLEEIHKHLS